MFNHAPINQNLNYLNSIFPLLPHKAKNLKNNGSNLIPRNPKKSN